MSLDGKIIVKKRIVSGITATGNLTLGNYIGSIMKLKEYQESDSYELFLFVADYHAITLPIEGEVLRENIKNILKLYLASGINSNKVKIFRQSSVKEILPFYYYLTVNSNIGQLERMTQFKDKTIKLKNGTKQIPSGLLMYPVLMAADILIYDADLVVVGEDQKQHIELTRDLALKINKTYGLDFKVPKPVISKVEEGARVMSLKEPTKKMSKSDTNLNNVIFLLDKEEDVYKKIKSAVTDDENKVYYDIENKPGVSNLLTIYATLSNTDMKEVEKKFKEHNYKDFKEEVANLVVSEISKIRDRYEMISDADLEEVINMNMEEIRKITRENLLKIEKKQGMV